MARQFDATAFRKNLRKQLVKEIKPRVTQREVCNYLRSRIALHEAVNHRL
jgi:hypothetical protein